MMFLNAPCYGDLTLEYVNGFFLNLKKAMYKFFFK